MDIVHGCGKPHAGLYAGFSGQPDTVQRLVKSALLAAEQIIGIAYAIKADPQIVITDGRDIIDIVLVYHGAV